MPAAGDGFVVASVAGSLICCGVSSLASCSGSTADGYRREGRRVWGAVLPPDQLRTGQKP